MIAVVTILCAFPLGYYLRSRLAANTTYAIAYLWAFVFQTLYLILDALGESTNPAFEGGDFPIEYGAVTLLIFAAGFGPRRGRLIYIRARPAGSRQLRGDRLTQRWICRSEVLLSTRPRLRSPARTRGWSLRSSRSRAIWLEAQLVGHRRHHHAGGEEQPALEPQRSSGCAGTAPTSARRRTPGCRPRPPRVGWPSGSGWRSRRSA